MPASAKTEMTIRIDPAQSDALDALAAREGRDRLHAVSKAVEASLERPAWQEA